MAVRALASQQCGLELSPSVLRYIRVELVVGFLPCSERFYFQVFRFTPLLERFSYDLEMKTREQNRNSKRTEIKRFDWFIERTNKRAWLFIG